MKAFIDPRTTEKLVILKHAETLAGLSEVIDLEDIPVQYGGKFKYEAGMAPSLDERIRQQLQWIGETKERFPSGPLKWIEKEGQRTAVVTGSANGKQVCLPFAMLKAKKDCEIATP